MKDLDDGLQLNLFVHDVDCSETGNLSLRCNERDSPPSALISVESPGDPISADAVEECEWAEFIRLHGRVPKLGDAKQPWQYRGWLLYYRLLCEGHPDVVPRWDYWVRTRLAGKLLDEPIPTLQFHLCGSREVYKQLEKWLLLVDHLHSHWSPMDTLLDWFLWGFALGSEPPKISDRLNEELYRNVNIGSLLLAPYDYIGEWIANQKGKWNPHAFFPTPHSVVEMMVQMTLNSPGCGEDLRAQTVMEPALGSGRMLLHASNYSLRLYGVDIDRLMVKAALVNGALYAPWMVRSLPEHYFVQPGVVNAVEESGVR